MSGTTLVNFRLDQETKRSMEGVCHDLGMSMTTAFTLFAKKVDRERRIPFDVSLDGTPSPDVAQPVTIAANHADPAVIVEEVVRVFGEGATERRALDGASLTVRRGEFVAIMGPSGSGKSTLLHILGGVDSATSGRVVVDGMDLSTLGANALALYRRHTVGLVYQFHNLVPFLSARDNIELPVRFDGSRPDPATIAELLELLDIADCEKSMPSELSGGQQQRVAIARALVARPQVLLLDEPLGALDLKLRKEMQLELKRLQREMNITFVYVTHDQEEALTMSDTVVVMNKGNIQQIGSPQDIYNEPRNAFVAKFIGDSNIVDGVMHKDFLVSFSGVDFPCVDRGFAREQSVQVVVRPEDIEVVSPVEGQLVGVVNDVIFKGVHFEMHVECEGREWLIHSTRACTPGETIGMRIGPNEIHIMARSEG